MLLFLFESGLDVGLISEYLFDDRDDELATSLEDDVQSTELLIGLIQDVDSNNAAWSIEASRPVSATVRSCQ